MSQEQIVSAICAFDDDAAVKVITDTLTLRPEVAPVVVKNACPDLAFAPASAFMARRSAGYVKQAADSSGFGLIENPELKLIFGQDVSAHRDQLGAMEPGAPVNFAVLLTDDEKPQAFDILPGHEGASKPGAVNASHLAAAQLLQGLPKQQALEAPPPPNNSWNNNGYGDNWNQGWNQNQGGQFGGKDGWNQGGGKDSFGKGPPPAPPGGGWNDGGKGGYDCKGGFGGPGKDGFGGKDGWMDPNKGGWSNDFGKGGCNDFGKDGGKGKKW